MDEEDTLYYSTTSKRLSEYAEEQKCNREFPSKYRKRKVYATINTFVGLGDLSASHFNIIIEEEHNHFYINSNTLVRCEDEPENGKKFDFTTKDRNIIEQRINEIFASNFGKGTHELIVKNIECLNYDKESLAGCFDINLDLSSFKGPGMLSFWKN